MSSTPNFAVSPHVESGVPPGAAANINTDAPTNTVLICAAPADKPMSVTRITAVPRASLAAVTPAYLFTSANATGTVQRLKDSTNIQVQTLSATNGPTKAVFGDYSPTTPINLGPGQSLWGGLGSAQNVVFQAEVADF